MTIFALCLVLVSAALHATWNLAAKRAGSGGMPFIFLAGLIIVALYLPVLAVYGWIWRPTLTWPMAAVIAVSGILKAAYAVCLQRAYRYGDFSLVYPLARGSGPLLAHRCPASHEAGYVQARYWCSTIHGRQITVTHLQLRIAARLLARLTRPPWSSWNHSPIVSAPWRWGIARRNDSSGSARARSATRNCSPCCCAAARAAMT
jgi:hypothetical protein